MSILIESKNKNNPYYIPARLIMNNSTISIFKSENFENIVITINLNEFSFNKSKN